MADQMTEVRYPDDDLKMFEEILLKKRAQVVKKISYLQSILKSTESEQNGGNVFGDPVDRGSDAMEREMNNMFLQRERKYLKQIDESLELIKTKKYGICEITGKLIPKERLKAVPTTTFTIKAKEKRNEKKKIIERNPKLLNNKNLDDPTMVFAV